MSTVFLFLFQVVIPTFSFWPIGSHVLSTFFNLLTAVLRFILILSNLLHRGQKKNQRSDTQHFVSKLPCWRKTMQSCQPCYSLETCLWTFFFFNYFLIGRVLKCSSNCTASWLFCTMLILEVILATTFAIKNSTNI